MRNQQEIKSALFFKTNTRKGIFKKNPPLPKIFLVPLIIFSTILTLNTSCKQIKYENENETEVGGRSQEGAFVSREKVIEYLQKSYLIKDPMNYKIKLTKDDLYIDGKKQPSNIHLHIIRNFVKNPDGHLEVTYKVSTD